MLLESDNYAERVGQHHQEFSRIQAGCGIIRVTALCSLCRYRHNGQWQGDFDRVERARLKRHHRHFSGNRATNAQVIDILRDKLALQLHPPSEMLLSGASCDSDLALELRPSVLGRVGL